MFEIKTLVYLTLLGLSSLVKTEMQPNKKTLALINEQYVHSSKKNLETLVQFLYRPLNIQHLLRRNFLFAPIIASNSAIYNKDLYGPSSSENIQYKRHPKSVFIVYPENQRPTNQPCNLNITEYTTTPPPTTVVEDHKTCSHASDEHLTPTDSTTLFNIPQPTNPSLLSTSIGTIHPPSSTSATIETKPTTSAVPKTSSSENLTRPAIQTTTANIVNKHTTTTTIVYPNEVTLTTSRPWTISTNKTTTPTRPTKSPTTIKDSSGTGNTSPSENLTRPTIQTTIATIGDKQTTKNTINPNLVTPTTSRPWTVSTNKIPALPTRPTIFPPTIKDPTGIGNMQCSFNGLYRANNFTCDQYLVCINGVTYLMDCPNGLAFNDDKKTCDWPGNVEGCNPRAFKNFECPYDKSGEDNKISTYRYRDSCSQFIACYRRKPRLLNCRDGFSFDEDSEDCIYFKSVTNCKNIIYSF